ncbi:hypothetical protein EsH8_IX_000188 [Colletotrichum jinshuiense]
MASVRSPTYILAPNWDFRPGGPIAIGNIIGDPFRPHRWLSKLAANTPPLDTQVSTQKNWHIETERIRSVNVNLWTQVFELAHFDIGARKSRATNIAFEMSQLDTIYLSEEPSIDDIANRARDPRVRAILRTDSRFRRRPVYMVTGLKIARGFKLTQSASTERGGRLGVGAQMTPEVSLGGEVDTSTQTRRADGFEAQDDIIFAYQLLRIKPKGKGEKTSFEVEEFQDDAAFLDDEEEDDSKENNADHTNLEADVASLTELSETQKGLSINPDHEQYDWLFPSE